MGFKPFFQVMGDGLVVGDFFFFLLKEKKKKRIGGKTFRSTVLNSSGLSQAWPGDTSQLRGGFPLWLRPARAGLRLSPSSLWQMDGRAADLSERPFQPSFLPAWGVLTSRGGGPLGFLNSLVESREMGQSGLLP